MGQLLKLCILLDLFLSITCVRVILLNTTRDGWKDWKKNTEKYQGWRIQNLPPNGDEVYGVCDINQKSANSWLRSPFISRKKGIIIHVKLSFTMRECKSYPDPRLFVNCEEVFNLLKYEADLDTDEVQYNEKYFVNVETISSNVKWEGKDRTESILNVHESFMSVRRTGLIIAFKNTGSCVMIKEVVVFYSSCQVLENNFVYFPQTATGSGQFIRNVQGYCVDGAARVPSSDQLINYCESSGIWRTETFIRMCECNPGYEANVMKTKCLKCRLNYFKSMNGNLECVACPENSYSPVGSARCYCSSGYYEIPSKTDMLLCKKPPPKPKNIHLDASDQARIILAWDSLNGKDATVAGEGDTVNYSIVCINCPNKLIFYPSQNTTKNRIIIHGALPSREYNFKVTTENYVTHFVTNAFDIDQSASRASVLTSPLENIEKLVIDKAEKVDNSIRITWQKPKSSSTVVEYECVLFGYKDHLMSINAKNPDLALYSFGFETQHVFEKLDTQIIQFTVRVRWRNPKGWGHYSETKIIEAEKVPQLKANVEVTMNPHTYSNISTSFVINPVITNSQKDVILVVIGAILLVVILVVVVILVSLCIRRQILFSAYKMKIRKNKYGNTIPTQIIYSSAYSLPIQSYVKYHDPSTYEDISIALQDFTKEVDPNWITTEELIGEGEFADVFRGFMKVPRSDDKMVAVKILKESSNAKAKNNFLIEASTMGQFVHENIVRLQGVISLTEPYMIITEYMVNGALLTFLIANKDNMTIIDTLKMLSNIVAGMRYLSSIGFIHRDLAARNILLDADLTCKISDFGLSRELNLDDVEQIYQQKNDIKIPIRWTSPEAILYQSFSQASDVWSFGVVAWEILSYGDKPYWQWSNQDVIDAIQSGYRLPPPVNCPPIIHNLMLHCWNCKPEQRPTFTQLYLEMDNLISQIHPIVRTPDSNSRIEYKSCEKAQLLRHCIESQNDINHDFIAPQPPPRNVVFDSRNGKVGSTPEAIGFPLTLSKQSTCSNTNPSVSELQIKEPIKSLGKNSSAVIPIQTYYPNNLFYQPCMLPLVHDYRPYGSDVIVPSHQDIPGHSIINHHSSVSKMSLEEFLDNIHVAQYTALFRQSGIHTVDQLRQIKYNNLRSLGIVSKDDRRSIIKALKPSIYC